MLNRLPLKVKSENIGFYKTTRVAYWFGLFAHTSSILLFMYLGIKELVFFNLFVSLPSFLFAIINNRLGKHNLAFMFAFLELLIHQVLAVYYTGWGVGFQFWLIYLAGLCFFNPNWKRGIQLSLLLLIVVTYTLLYIFFQEGKYSQQEVIGLINYLLNSVSTIVVLSLLINYFTKETKKAGQKLIEEKQVTEKQSKQLSEQYNSLLSEQNKTHRMLTKIEALFGQQVSHEVARELMKSETEIDSKIYEATIMFLDIRDFTHFADSREPAEVARFQNIVFSVLIDIVKAHNGIVSQILGDGIMAVFGAPVSDKNHVANAVNSGFSMIKKIKELGENGTIPSIKIGIGLNSGKIMAGNVGNETRKFYSLTGTNVIIAARMEQLNKKFNSQFLVSASVYKVIKNDFSAVDLGKTALKGIENKMSVYKLA